MEELQDAIEDAQYVNAIQSQDDGPRPLLPWDFPTDEEVLKEWETKKIEKNKDALCMEWTLKQPIGFFLFSSYIKETHKEFVRINFVEDVARHRKLTGKARLKKAREMAHQYLIPPTYVLVTQNEEDRVDSSIASKQQETTKDSSNNNKDSSNCNTRKSATSGAAITSSTTTTTTTTPTSSTEDPIQISSKDNDVPAVVESKMNKKASASTAHTSSAFSSGTSTRVAKDPFGGAGSSMFGERSSQFYCHSAEISGTLSVAQHRTHKETYITEYDLCRLDRDNAKRRQQQYQPPPLLQIELDALHKLNMDHPICKESSVGLCGPVRKELYAKLKEMEQLYRTLPSSSGTTSTMKEQEQDCRNGQQERQQERPTVTKKNSTLSSTLSLSNHADIGFISNRAPDENDDTQRNHHDFGEEDDDDDDDITQEQTAPPPPPTASDDDDDDDGAMPPPPPPPDEDDTEADLGSPVPPAPHPPPGGKSKKVNRSSSMHEMHSSGAQYLYGIHKNSSVQQMIVGSPMMVTRKGSNGGPAGVGGGAASKILLRNQHHDELMKMDVFGMAEVVVVESLRRDYWDKFIESEHFQKFKNFCWYQDRRVVPDDFFILRPLGRGGFGLVTACKKGTSGKLYAMKVMNKRRIKLKQSEKLALNERQALAAVESKFVVNLKYSFHSKDDVYLILDLMTGGDLGYHLSKKIRFPKEECLYYAARIMLALQALHDKNYVYRDLKPENCLLADDGRVKITDLGLATKITPTLHGAAGTRGYWAPEMLRRDRHGKRMSYGHTVDWFSFGCCVAEFISGSNPFRSEAALNFGLERGKQTKEKAIDCATLEMDPVLSSRRFDPDAADLCRRLLDKNEKTRLGCSGKYARGCEEIMAHPWFERLNWDSIVSDRERPPFVPPTDVNAISQQEIGTFAEDKAYQETQLTEQDEELYNDWDWTNRMAFSAEVIEFLIYERETGEPLLPLAQHATCCCTIM